MTAKIKTRVERLERTRDDRRRCDESLRPGHTKEPVDHAAVNAILEELLESAPMGRDAALAMMVNAIPKCLRGTPATGGR